MEPRNRCQGINSASLCSLAGRYDNPIPTRCLAPIDFLKIPAQFANSSSTWEVSAPAALTNKKPENFDKIQASNIIKQNGVRTEGGTSDKFKNLLRHLLRPGSIHACSLSSNASRGPASLKQPKQTFTGTTRPFCGEILMRLNQNKFD
jgi:hypothetical protein